MHTSAFLMFKTSSGYESMF